MLRIKIWLENNNKSNATFEWKSYLFIHVLLLYNYACVYANICFINVLYEWCMYEDKNVNKVLHICRHYFLILLMFTFLYKIYSMGLFNVFENFKFNVG